MKISEGDKSVCKAIKLAKYGLFCWVPYIFQILTNRYSIQMKNTKQNNCTNIYLKNTKGGFQI